MLNKDSGNIQEKMLQLDELLAWFDSEEFHLEQALKKFKVAEQLAGEIEADLLTLKNDIEVVKKRFDEGE